MRDVYGEELEIGDLVKFAYGIGGIVSKGVVIGFNNGKVTIAYTRFGEEEIGEVEGNLVIKIGKKGEKK